MAKETFPPEIDRMVVEPCLTVTVEAAGPIKTPPMSMFVPIAIPAPVVQADDNIVLVCDI